MNSDEIKSKNFKLATDFYNFCCAHPELRFWQALHAWSQLPNIVVMNVNGKVARDTFYFEGKDK